MSAYLAVLRRYAEFSGRSTRKEFWTFMLVHVVVLLLWFVALVATAENETLSASITVPGVLYVVATLVPELAVRVRRLHDTGRSGWWLLLAVVPLIGPVVLLVFLCQASESGANAYGPHCEDFASATLEAGTRAA